MFEGKTLWAIFSVGGFTMYILLICSIISIGVIIERFLYYKKKSKVKRTVFMSKIRKEIKGGNVPRALDLAEKGDTPITNVVLQGLKLHGQSDEEISSAMEREITVETILLEKYTSVVGTIGNIAVYIGLFGTVLGIIKAFHDISRIGSGGMSVVIGGVSEALVCTATGLSVAIPAVIAYNYFSRRIDIFVNDMELCASELIDLISKKYK
jgi:biopolymer transport protein ExbB